MREDMGSMYHSSMTVPDRPIRGQTRKPVLSFMRQVQAVPPTVRPSMRKVG
jgi:hypothetical protein